MKQQLLVVIFSSILLCLFFNFSLNGQTPIVLGGDLTYICVGSNSYTINANIITDCRGADLPDSIIVDWSGSCSGVGSGTITLPKIVGPTDITPGGNSYCNGGAGTMGVEQYTYSSTFVVPTGCSTVELGWSTCCHSDSLGSIVTPEMTPFHIETEILSMATPCNSSILFLNPGIVVACKNAPSSFNQGAMDPDGDSLHFSLINCYQDANNTVNYQPSFSGLSPLGATVAVTIDPETGTINWTGATEQTAMICVLVEEIRGGIIIGSTLREIGLIVEDCGINNLPLITGIDSTGGFDTTVVFGQPFCFDIHGEDLDANQTLLMFWDSTITGATFTIDTTNKPIGTFCWTPTAQDTGQHTFVVTVNDNGTPIGVVAQTFTINVVTGLGVSQGLVNEIGNKMRLYPNPASNNLHITFDFPLEEPLDVQIINLQGKIVLEQKNVSTNLKEITIKQLKSGLYAVIALDKKRRIIEQQKLIVR